MGVTKPPARRPLRLAAAIAATCGALLAQSAPSHQADVAAAVSDMLAALERGDSGPFLRAFDGNAFAERALAGLDAPDVVHEHLGRDRGAAEAAGRRLLEHAQRGRLDLLSVRAKDGPPHAVVRALLDDGGLDYHELVLTRASGAVRIVDHLDYLDGELASERVRRVRLEDAPDDHETVLRARYGAATEVGAVMQSVRDMHLALQRREHARCLEIWSELPSRVQREPAYLRVRVSAALHLGNEAIEAAHDDLARYVARDDGNRLLLMLQHWHRKRDARRVVECSQQLEDRVGGDPLLKVVRARAIATLGDRRAARNLATAARDADPTLSAAHSCLLDLTLQDGDHAATAAALTRFGAQFPLDLDEITGDPRFGDFIASNEGRAWLERARPR